MNNILSPNMLKTFETCPKKFEFKYVKNLSMPVDDDIFETGKNIHALASYYLKKENIDVMEKVLSEKEELLWTYLKNIKYFSYECVNTEYNLSVKIGNNFFGGRLDALMKNNQNNKEHYYILDYKTGLVPKDAKYDYQTIIYMLAVKEFFKTANITFVYIDLKNKSETEINLTNELVQIYETKLREIAKKIEKRDNFNKNNENCPCEYKIICY